MCVSKNVFVNDHVYNLTKGEVSMYHDVVRKQGVVETYLNGKLFKTTVVDQHDILLVHTYVPSYNHVSVCDYIAEVVDCGVCGSIVLSWVLCN